MAPNQRNWIPKKVPNMSERPENGFKVDVDEKCEQQRQKLTLRPCLKQSHGSTNEISAQNGTKSKSVSWSFKHCDWSISDTLLDMI